MTTSTTHSAAINTLARRISRTSDATEANSFAPALAALALDKATPLDLPDGPTTGGVTGGFGTPTPIGPSLPPNKTLQCTTNFRTGSAALNQSIDTVDKELKSTTLTAQQKAALQAQLVTLGHEMSVLIANYTECLVKAVGPV